MTTLTERLNIVAGDMSGESSLEVLVMNKKTMTVTDMQSAIDAYLYQDDLDESEITDTANVIADFSPVEGLPFGGEVSIWFDAK